MSKHNIEVEGLPEGYRAVAYRKPVFGEYYFYNDGIQQGRTGSGQFLIVEKIQPRRIVLEETEEKNTDIGQPQHFNIDSTTTINIASHKIWRIKEEWAIEFRDYEDGTIEVIYEGVGTLGWLYYGLGDIELTLHENTDIESVEKILSKMKELRGDVTK